jgi:hypothetical protein
MMEIHVIKIKGGKVDIKVQGVKGSGCLDATQSVEKALGKKMSDAKTGEYYEQQQINQSGRR